MLEHKHHKPIAPRDEELIKNLLNRTNRIEGQVRGIKKMIESDEYCDDILNQIFAVKSALDSVSKLLLKHHIHGCLIEDIKQGEHEVVDELIVTIGKLIK